MAKSVRSARPGDYLSWDYRQSSDADTDHKHADANGACIALHLVQWNIERGYQLERIIATLRELDADIITLQELDISCERTSWANIAKEIAKALSCQIVFSVEFEEFDSERRSHENRCGGQSRHGKAMHGNAILSKKHTLLRPTVVPHSWLLDWDVEGERLNEPRTGFRSFLRCEVELEPHHIVAIYSLHLEIFQCGPLNRVRQLGDIIHDATALYDATMLASSTSTDGPAHVDQPTFHVFIGGDFNTIGHSIVRCSPKYHSDRMRWLNLGENEATWLQRKVLCRNLPQETSWMQRFATNADWVWRWVYGFSAAELEKIRNDKLFLWDPFDKYMDVTLNNPAYRGFVQGKLDWVLVSNMQVRTTEVFNHDYLASDHKGLAVRVTLRAGTTPSECYVPWHRNVVGEVLPYLAVRLLVALGVAWVYAHTVGG